jgi:diaminopimelate epimerase
VSLAFTKMHGLGNDFAVLDARAQHFVADAQLIRRMGDRQRGIGFDQLLTLHQASAPDCVAALRIWNRDGTRAEQCGNGLRCVAAWLARAGAIALGAEARLQTDCAVASVRVHAAHDVEADMGVPDFTPVAVGFSTMAGGSPYRLNVAGAVLDVAVVSMGNPHAVVAVDDLAAPALDILGPALTAHGAFAHGVNAGFVRVLDRTHLALRVHERGAGWTQACGSGACAAMAVLRAAGCVDAEIAVALPGGTLGIRWDGPGARLWMRGPAAFVYEGVWLHARDA